MQLRRILLTGDNKTEICQWVIADVIKIFHKFYLNTAKAQI